MVGMCRVRTDHLVGPPNDFLLEAMLLSLPNQTEESKYILDEMQQHSLLMFDRFSGFLWNLNYKFFSLMFSQNKTV